MLYLFELFIHNEFYLATVLAKIKGIQLLIQLPSLPFEYIHAHKKKDVHRGECEFIYTFSSP